MRMFRYQKLAKCGIFARMRGARARHARDYDYRRRGGLTGLSTQRIAEVEQQCRRLVANSVHLPGETKIRSAGGAV